MPIDTSIYNALKPAQIESPLDAYSKVAQVQQMQNQNRLADLVFGEKQREAEQANTFNQLYKNAVGPDGKIDRSAVLTGAAQNGLGSKIPGLQKSFLETDEAQGKVDKQKVELIDSKLKQSRAYLENVTTPEQYIAWHEANHKDPILGPELAARGVTAEQARASIMAALQKPGGFEELLNKSRLGIEKFAELNKPTVHVQNLGGNSQITSVPGMGGAPTVLSSAPITQSADSKASVAATMRGQNMTDARAKETLAKEYAVNGINRDGTPTGDVEAMAQGIAGGKLAPINGFALAKPRGQAIMARVMEINPTYDAGDYQAKNAALKGFATGKEGTALRSFNVASDHLDTLGQMSDALNNGNSQMLNKIGNAWNQQTGNPAPTNFNAVKEIVGKEVVKAIVAGGGGVHEREELSNLLDRANSPAQLKGVISHFKELMDAQRSGLMDQYQRTTGRTDGEKLFSPSKRIAPAVAGGKPSLDEIFK